MQGRSCSDSWVFPGIPNISPHPLPLPKKTCFSRLGWEKRRKDTRELVGLTSNRRLLKMTSLTLLPTSRAGSGGRGQSAASAAAGSERERGGGVGVERVAGTADARDWRAVGGAAEEPGRGRGETGWVLAR